MKSYNFFKIYLLLVSLFFVYIMLYIFVIPEKGTIVENNNTYSSIEESSIEEEIVETIITDIEYKDANIDINISTIREYNTQVYIADIYVSSIDYIKTAFAQNTFGRNIKEPVSTMAKNNNAILAINGDYYGFRTTGFVLRNGVIYRSSSYGNEDLAIMADGSFYVFEEGNANLEDLLNDGALQVFSFGPALINNKELVVDTKSEVEKSLVSNPRTAIGIIDNLHYVFIVSDGRTDESEGLTLYELANIMKDLGCTVAYNLDGGGSTTMYFNGNIINRPINRGVEGERKVSDAVYVGY